LYAPPRGCAIVTAAPQFTYVTEQENFLALFPHRYDFIYASHPSPREKPDWRTEDRYPLSDRQLLKGEQLYGVRFEKETQYFLLDIDTTSPYHPTKAPLALERLLAALEPLGLLDSIICTSSDSGGLHVYFPLSHSFNSWKLSKAVSIAVENAGFKFNPGCLEIFPNPRSYVVEETPSLFNAHRIPLQMGSYVLNDELQPVSSSQTHFVRMWQFCQRRNQLNQTHVKRLLKQAKQVDYRLSNKASKFLSDLDTEIDTGWTDRGQTNRLLGRITMRCFIFDHITEGGNPLEGKALTERIVSVAIALPGYKDWCGHQHEIENRADEWARCIENSHYFPYGTQSGKYKALKPDIETETIDWNQQRSQETQAKIIQAVQEMTEQGTLPERATARFKALLQFNIGGASLYRYRELWHPINLENSELQNTAFGEARTGGANLPKNLTSLLPHNDGNPHNDKASSDHDDSLSAAEGNNSADPTSAIRDRIRQQLAQTQKEKTAAKQQPTGVDDATKAVHRRALQRMREFLLSGEPILLIEVGQWLAKQPASVQGKLVNEGGDLDLLSDLAAIAKGLVRSQLSPWEVRLQLEQRYGKLLILELSETERHEWQSSLGASDQTPGSG
jgi:hypothetical protein